MVLSGSMLGRYFARNASNAITSGSFSQRPGPASLEYLIATSRVAFSKPAALRIERPVDPADNSCSGFQPSSATLRIDCDDALPGQLLSKTSPPDCERLSSGESS